jgi:indolepyruvate ferredoxin oxidoreductase beta subunit
MQMRSENLLQLTEYFHPRAEEIVGLLPVKVGAQMASRSTAHEADRQHSSIADAEFGQTARCLFFCFGLIGGLRNWRMKTLRHHQEMKHLDRWLSDFPRAMQRSHYGLAVELIRCRRLIKGYSDTHAAWAVQVRKSDGSRERSLKTR